MSHRAPSYEIIDHTADLGIIVRAPDLKGLFSGAARAMTELMVRGEGAEKRSVRQISLDAEDYPDLMVRWLGEVLYLFAADHVVLDTAEIASIAPTRLAATIVVGDFDPRRHRVLREIKAVTYHGISVQRLDDRWETRIIFDI